MSGQDGAGRPRGRREVNTSRDQKDGERPRGRKIAKRDGNIEGCQVVRRAPGGLEAELPGGRLVTGKAPSFSEGSWMDLHFSN